MNHQDTNTLADSTSPESQARDDLMRERFDAALVFADPVTYLANFGLRSELIETQHRGLPAAA